MPKVWIYKMGFVLALTAISIALLIPSFFEPEDPDDRESWPSWYSWYTDNIYDGTLVMGLDLQGGLHMQYRVDVDTALRRKLDQASLDIAERLMEMDVNIDENDVSVFDDTSIMVQLPEGQGTEELDEILIDHRYLDSSTENDTLYRLEYRDEEIEQTRLWALETAMSTIRSRVDSFGVAEPSITTRGTSDIIVQLPGLGSERFEEAKNLIGTTAQLEFRGLHAANSTYWPGVSGLVSEFALSYETETGNSSTVVYETGRVRSNNLEELRQFTITLENLQEGDPAALPNDATVVYSEQVDYDPITGDITNVEYSVILAQDRVEMTGETISDVRAASDPQTNQPFVSINFDNEGRRLFCEVTERFVQEQLAIVLDDVVKSAPVIEERICGGRARITMGSGGSYEARYLEVQGLVIVLRHGALPAPIEPQFETQVGPSLGADSVRKGSLSMMVGSILVIFFMVLYYRKSGLIANVALILNILFILALLTAVGATITLPGIAGIILTVGMAVDANVIIFERVREELRLGKTSRDAIQSGYSKALWTVLDANITTAIAALVLANYGSGPIKGFAVTLLFGIISSVFTALFVTRLLFDYSVIKNRVKRLSIGIG